MFNRNERRAIERGEGRHEPMIEIVDLDSAIEYMFQTDGAGRDMYEEMSRMFISRQVYVFDFRDDWEEWSA